MKSVPTDAVDAGADLLPSQLLVNKVTHHAATQLATLPSTHPLAKHMQKVAGRYVKCHKSPVHDILHAFDIQPSAFKKVQPTRCGSKWEPGAKVWVPESREWAVVEAKESRSEVQVYADRSGIDGSV